MDAQELNRDLGILAAPEEELRFETELSGDGATSSAIHPDAVGYTMFDTPSSDDGSVTVILPRENIEKVPRQSLVRILSRDGRRYLGAVVKGPFAEPDGLRADAPVLVTATARGGLLLPKYHGRVQVNLMGEELPDGGVVPPRRRPLPNSPVLVLDAGEAAAILRSAGEIRLGQIDMHEDMEARVPLKKSVLPRHLGILGTTGGGKSTTVSGLVAQLQRLGAAVVLLDTEGEYTAIHEPTVDATMQEALKRRGMVAHGVDGTHLYHLVGRDTTNPDHPSRTQFRLNFSGLSPYAVKEILDLSDAQETRFFQAYEACKALLRDFKIYPADKDEEREALEIDEFSTGYPRMTLSHLIDIAGVFLHVAGKRPEEPEPYNDIFRKNLERVLERVRSYQPSSEVSWRALLAKLWRLHRLGIFDTPKAKDLNFARMVQPGVVSIVDLSDTESSEVRNLAIAQLLRGIQQAQERSYEAAVAAGKQPTPVVMIIEEAHEFLSADRIKRMPVLFQQVARLARRGRKRWLCLAFSTQLPQHLPDEVLGLINNWILHKIADAGVVSRLRRSISGIDEGLWSLLPALAPGQAVVSFTSLARPLLVAMDPTPCKLLMID